MGISGVSHRLKKTNGGTCKAQLPHSIRLVVTWGLLVLFGGGLGGLGALELFSSSVFSSGSSQSGSPVVLTRCDERLQFRCCHASFMIGITLDRHDYLELGFDRISVPCDLEPNSNL